MGYYFSDKRRKLDFNRFGLKYSQTPIIIKIRNMKHDNTCQSWPSAVLNFGDIKEDDIIMRKKSPITFKGVVRFPENRWYYENVLLSEVISSKVDCNTINIGENKHFYKNEMKHFCMIRNDGSMLCDNDCTSHEGTCLPSLTATRWKGGLDCGVEGCLNAARSHCKALNVADCFNFLG